METVPFDVILSFAIGIAAAYTARTQLRASSSVVRNRWFVALLVFQGLVFCPLGAYLYAVHPGWSLNYLVEPDRLPAVFGVVAISAYAVFAVAGWMLGARLVREGRERALLSWLAGSVLALLAMLAAFASRFWWVGTYAAYRSVDRAASMEPIVRSRLGWVLGVAGPLFLFVLAVMLRRNRAHGVRLERSEVPQN